MMSKGCVRKRRKAGRGTSRMVGPSKRYNYRGGKTKAQALANLRSRFELEVGESSE